MKNLREVYNRFITSGFLNVNEIVNQDLNNVSDFDLEKNADKVLSMEEMLKMFIEKYAYPNISVHGTFSVSGSLIEDGRGWVDFVTVECAHISDSELIKHKNDEAYLRQYIDRDISGSLIFETTMSKSKPIRPVKIKYLDCLALKVRNKYSPSKDDLGHIYVYIGEWTKRFGLKGGNFTGIKFNDLDFNTQNQIYKYITSEIEHQQSFLK